jgi:hypothetical protein
MAEMGTDRLVLREGRDRQIRDSVFFAEIESTVGRVLRQLRDRDDQMVKDLLEEAFVAGIEFERSCRRAAFGQQGLDPAPSFEEWLAAKIASVS